MIHENKCSSETWIPEGTNSFLRFEAAEFVGHTRLPGYTIEEADEAAKGMFISRPLHRWKFLRRRIENHPHCIIPYAYVPLKKEVPRRGTRCKELNFKCLGVHQDFRKTRPSMYPQNCALLQNGFEIDLQASSQVLPDNSFCSTYLGSLVLKFICPGNQEGNRTAQKSGGLPIRPLQVRQGEGPS